MNQNRQMSLMVIIGVLITFGLVFYQEHEERQHTKRAVIMDTIRRQWQSATVWDQNGTLVIRADELNNAAYRQGFLATAFKDRRITVYLAVAATALDAIKRGYKVTVISDAIAGSNDEARDKALAELKGAGAQIETSAQFIASLGSASPSS